MPFKFYVCVHLLLISLHIFTKHLIYLSGFPGGARGKETACQSRRPKRHRFDLWGRKITWRRKWQPTPVFFPRESQGQRSLMQYSPQGRKEQDTNEMTSLHACTLCIGHWGYAYTYQPLGVKSIKN